MFKPYALLASLAMAATLVAAGPTFGAAKSTHKPAPKKTAKAPEFKLAPGDTLATLYTAKGPIVLELYTKETPLTAGNFVKLSKQGFYNGQTFHRVEPGFVIQAGDPNSKTPKDVNALSRMGTGGPGYTIKMEPSALKFHHDPGVIAMARTQDPNSAGSQFYITLGPAPFLDGKYAVFGKVLKGQNVAGKIQQWDKINKIVIGPTAK